MSEPQNAPESEAVKMLRDTFHHNWSPGWKQDVDATVTDLKLWRKVLDLALTNKWSKWSRHFVAHLCSLYESQEEDSQQRTGMR